MKAPPRTTEQMLAELVFHLSEASKRQQEANALLRQLIEKMENRD